MFKSFLSSLQQRAFALNSVSIALLVILVLGAFLRMYEFGDWLRFSPDQARDAAITFDITRGEIPLLGPGAGGTEFRLGPVTHYFSFLSGSLFGFTPPSLAYPELLFSILTLPLVFLLVSRLFGWKMGLLAALLSAFSGFMIRYGRFQWNPNTMPFFTILFLLSAQAFFDRETKRQYMWAIAFGVALGVGIQLHTFLLVLLPLLTVILFGFLAFHRRLSYGMAALSIAGALALNIPQILSETRTNFSNTEAFIQGVGGETESTRSYSSRLGRDALCHIRANAFILSALGHSDHCDRFVSTVKKKAWQHPIDIAHAIVEILFTVGGFFLLGWFAWKEPDERKRFLLVSVLLYSGLLFLLIVPVANEIAMRYFLASAFVPFVLLGAWGAFLFEKGNVFRVAFLVFCALLIVSNGWFLKKEYDFFRSGKVSDGDTAIWGETKPLAKFLSKNTAPGETAYLIGMKSYRKRFHKGFSYPLHLEGKTLLRWEDEGFPTGSGPVFLVRKKTKSFDEATEIDGRPILDRVTSGRVSVFLLRKGT